uniref:Uncharacterized protein n=1 Tax=Rhizophora mucronata TaxID=61149 RepID=A0A2P2QTL1_RHIMU
MSAQKQQNILQMDMKSNFSLGHHPPASVWLSQSGLPSKGIPVIGIL